MILTLPILAPSQQVNRYTRMYSKIDGFENIYIYTSNVVMLLNLYSELTIHL